MPKTKENSVKIKINSKVLEGNLIIPDQAKGIVLFAHGSGSSRFSPRNRYIAEVLQKVGIATLLIDLLTKSEEAVDDITAQLRFDIEMLAIRLGAVTEWLKEDSRTKNISIGYFGASTGAAAALIAATKYPEDIKAIVSRGGRPDLAIPHLSKVKAPTLLIVGGDDEEVIEMNQSALEKLNSTKRLEIVPGATHLFEEEGKLEEVARLAKEWFVHYLKNSI